MGKSSKKEKKDKKQKKDKKDKRSKKEKKEKDEVQMLWVEKENISGEVLSGNKEEEKMKREDWMIAVPKRQEKKESQEEKMESMSEEENKVHEKELNPYLNKDADSLNGSKQIGDGGASWRAKVLRRAKEQALESGKDVKEIIGQRFENVDEILREKIRDKGKSSYREKKWGNREYLQDSKDRQMKKPSISSELRWKRKREEDDQERRKQKDVTANVQERSTKNTPEQDKGFEESNNFPEIQEDPNQIAAQIIKAKILGDMSRVQELEKKLENTKKKKVETVIPVDDSGKPISLGIGHQAHATKRGKFETRNSDGTRARYFRDDDVDLKTLVQKERLHGTEDFDSHFAKNIMRKSNYKFDLDELGEQTDMWEASSKKKSRNKQESLQRKKAISSHNRLNKIQESCWFCFDNPQIDKSLIVSLGNYTYLALPKRGSLTEGHCLIVPMQHVTSIVSADENIFEEIELFKKSLVKMFFSQQRDVIFMETVLDVKKHNHTFIECIPLPLEVGAQAPIYFKKAITESEKEWSQHKKLIQVPPDRGIKRSVPEGFSYFFVEFGNEGGFAHVIEDEVRWNRQFGKEIMAGMLELDPEQWMKPKNEAPNILDRQMKNFLKSWMPWDWTSQLDGGEYQEQLKQFKQNY